MKRYLIFALVLSVSYGTGLLFFWLLPYGYHQFEIAKLSLEIVERCASSTFRPTCYDKEIPKVMGRPYLLSMEQAFSVTEKVQQSDPQYLYCHVLAHKLGTLEVERNPDKWKDVVTRCPTTMCNNGCPHGVLMKRFNSEHLTDAQIQVLLPDLKSVCEPRGNWHPAEVEMSMCYHSIGHLNMYITNADVVKSADICKQIGYKKDGRSYVQTCTEGVLMSVFQPLEPEDYALVKNIAPKDVKEAEVFCSQYSGEVFHACKRESRPLYGGALLDPKEGDIYCGYTNDIQAQKICYGSLMSFVTVRLVMDNKLSIDSLAVYCSRLSEKWKSECFSMASSRLIQIDPKLISLSFSICNAAENLGYGNACYEQLIDLKKVYFSPNSKELIGYCERFPGEYVQKCKSN